MIPLADEFTIATDLTTSPQNDEPNHLVTEIVSREQVPAIINSRSKPNLPVHPSTNLAIKLPDSCKQVSKSSKERPSSKYNENLRFSIQSSESETSTTFAVVSTASPCSIEMPSKKPLELFPFGPTSGEVLNI